MPTGIFGNTTQTQSKEAWSPSDEQLSATLRSLDECEEMCLAVITEYTIELVQFRRGMVSEDIRRKVHIASGSFPKTPLTLMNALPISEILRSAPDFPQTRRSCRGEEGTKTFLQHTTLRGVNNYLFGTKTP